MEPNNTNAPNPAPAAVPAPAPAPAAPSPAVAVTAVPVPSRKILCVEDEHFISELYVRALTRAGYDVTVEVDGGRALALAKTDQFDIILLDIMVPTLTGVEILRRLRDPAETPQRLKAKIIITTNLDQKEDIRADIEHRADGYLVKADITPRELVAMLDSMRV